MAANRPAAPRGKSSGADNDRSTKLQRKINDRAPPSESSWRHGQKNLPPVWKNPEAEPPRRVLRTTLRLACLASAQHRSRLRGQEPAAGNTAAELRTDAAGDGAGAAPRSQSAHADRSRPGGRARLPRRNPAWQPAAHAPVPARPLSRAGDVLARSVRGAGGADAGHLRCGVPRWSWSAAGRAALYARRRAGRPAACADRWRPDLQAAASGVKAGRISGCEAEVRGGGRQTWRLHVRSYSCRRSAR